MKKAQEEARVAQLIQRAEEEAARPSQDNDERARRLLKSLGRKDSSVQLVRTVETSLIDVTKQFQNSVEAVEARRGRLDDDEATPTDPDTQPDSAEQRLSLTVAKEDFARMRIVGQFNLGFILATRSAMSSLDHTDYGKGKNKDEIFIIDQHASDEKYNFERLQSETTVQNQRLVVPRLLDLTAVEEEIIMAHPEALEKNGFQIEVDTSGDAPVGKRCKLISLPMSREVVFNTQDLEELLAFLADVSPTTSTLSIPRPTKVRRMFAMRACRSSVMVGKTLTAKQMGHIVRHMGEIDKPWNCPHGRPTMRHLMRLTAWDRWIEGDGIAGEGDQGMRADDKDKETLWANFVEDAQGQHSN